MWCDNLPRLLGKLSQVTFSYKVLQLKKIRYFSIVARGLLKTLAYHSFPKNNAKNTKILKQNV